MIRKKRFIAEIMGPETPMTNDTFAISVDQNAENYNL